MRAAWLGRAIAVLRARPAVGMQLREVYEADAAVIARGTAGRSHRHPPLGCEAVPNGIGIKDFPCVIVKLSGRSAIGICPGRTRITLAGGETVDGK